MADDYKNRLAQQTTDAVSSKTNADAADTRMIDTLSEDLDSENRKLNDASSSYINLSFAATSLGIFAAFFGVLALLSNNRMVQHSKQANSLQQQISAAKDRIQDRYKGSVQVQVAQANARADEANAQAEKARLEQEQLRADNLALQKLMQPRRLGSIVSFSNPDSPEIIPPAETQFGGIKAFAGTPVVIQVVPDFEAQTLANDMLLVFGSFGWNARLVTPTQSHVPNTLIEDGVDVSFLPGSRFAAAAQALATGLRKAGIVGPASSNGYIIAQGAPVNPDGTRPAFVPSFEPPLDAVIVMVGMKPIPQTIKNGPRP